MGWTSYYVGANCDRKEELNKYIRGFKDKDGNVTANLVKSTMKGTTFYGLMETTKEHRQFIVCVLTKIDKGEFYYKDFECNPRESGVPMSILKAFVPFDNEDKEWKEKQIAKIAADKANLKTFNFNDIVQITPTYDVEWGNGYKCKANIPFYVRVENGNPYGKRARKIYRVVEKENFLETAKKWGSPLSEKEILERNGGKVYRFSNTNCRLMEKTFKSFAKEIFTE